MVKIDADYAATACRKGVITTFLNHFRYALKGRCSVVRCANVERVWNLENFVLVTTMRHRNFVAKDRWIEGYRTTELRCWNEAMNLSSCSQRIKNRPLQTDVDWVRLERGTQENAVDLQHAMQTRRRAAGY